MIPEEDAGAFQTVEDALKYFRRMGRSLGGTEDEEDADGGNDNEESDDVTEG